ncbi:beta-glucosidase [Paenibacillus baekrokdamisoli]|uniref:beta-glucosidase family protein n=1 Tax=Paenibacillus baekrokdamisoli TaxID=1712516 RepID=UPI000F7B626D|nr:glycoside hydrolase family 3 C-terminal domain-containing protein [Paenibacillus baekrokdamisoli]MBB3072040.1 beta-glucosidase [Paenibacillus baekrokdamisoli]
MKRNVDQLLSQMTLEEKVALVSGADMWKTRAIERLGVDSIYMYDGTNGIRKTQDTNELGIFEDAGNIPATCFPTGSALGSSWNVELLEEIGIALGIEGKHLDVNLLLGPGINMKRSPLGGRNFEYYSEDPCLSGELGAAFVNGLQSEGVGASLKHFACNNQETEKMAMSSEVDERTLREIYLNAFERVVAKANPWTIMCSYNLLNGQYTSENEHLEREILREEWGYEGVVMSDWTAVHNRIKALQVGLDLEMPGPALYNNSQLIKAIESGDLDIETLNQSVRRMLLLHEKVKSDQQAVKPCDWDAHHELAYRAAIECIVLLKNDRQVLPLQPKSLSKLAVIGQLAKAPRYQGGGSARVIPRRLDIPYEEIVRVNADRATLSFAPGYGNIDGIDEALIAESVAIAAQSDAALLFVGMPEGTESEGFDGVKIDLPLQQVKLIQAVAAVQPNCIVILSNGSAIAMEPWLHDVPAVVDMWLTGQAGGSAIADVLFGLGNPSGKLSETFPVKLSDNPSYLSFGGEGGKAVYAEGLFVGYRYYDKKELAPQFPFGHGLSYTTFEYSQLSVSGDAQEVSVTFRLRNTGSMKGQEVVQLYVRDEQCRWIRPMKELKAFRKLQLQPGEEAEITFSLEPRDFSYYDPEYKKWVADTGYFEIFIGSSSQDLRLSHRIHLDFPDVRSNGYHEYSLLKEWIDNPQALKVLNRALMELNRSSKDQVSLDEPMLISFFGDAPLIKLFQMYGQDWLINQSPEQYVRQMIQEYELHSINRLNTKTRA